MILRYHPLSPYSRKVLVAVRHRGDPVDCQVIDLRGGGLRTAEFLALNPFGKMPVLDTGAGGLFESTSIIELLEESGERKLIPPGHEREARHWDRIGDLYLIEPMSRLWFEPLADDTADQRDTVGKAWGLVARRLDGNAFLAGPAFSLGDLGAAIASDYLVRLGEEPPPVIRAWMDRCFAVAAMADALDEALPYVTAFLARRAAKLGPKA
jgi:glutathione S-transferase